MSRTFRYRFLTVAALLATSLFAADYAAEGKLWWAHVQFLADDKLQGRDVGSPGFQEAANYVETQFKRVGLEPAGVSGYRQPIRFESRLFVNPTLDLVRGGKAELLVLGKEATPSSRADMAPVVEAPMVFLGYGMQIPEAKYDDLAGIDLKGKIAVYVNAAAPVNVSDNIKSHYGTANTRWAILKKAGAIGVATLPNPRPNAPGSAAGAPAPYTPTPTVMLADPELREPAGQKISINITRDGAEKFFEGSGHTYAEIEALAKDNQPLPRFALAGTLRGKSTLQRKPVESINLIGKLPGTDPGLKNEYVIFSAHLDHLGVGRPVNGDSIYNGALDNAAGVASVIEVAKFIKQSGVRHKRSMLFIALTAEEKGELGSHYFASHPTVPAKQIVADINLDMCIPIYKLTVIEVEGLTESTLGEQVTAAAKSVGVDVQTDREPEQNRFVRSDQYSFIREGIPALAFKFGYEYGSPEEKLRRDWVNQRYHKPSDDVNQPVDQASSALFNRVMQGLIERVADDPARPHWNADSFFKRFEK